MSSFSEQDLGDLGGLNDQMLGGRDNQIIDVTEIPANDDGVVAARKKKKRYIIAGVAGATLLIAFFFLNSKPTALPAPAVDAVLAKHLDHPSSFSEDSLPPASDLPASSPALAVSAASSAVVVLSNGVTSAPLAPSSATPVAETALVKPEPVPADQDQMKKLNDQVAAMKVEMEKKDKAYKALLDREAALGKAKKEEASKKAIETKRRAESSEVRSRKEDASSASKPIREVSIAKSGVTVLMDKGLIYVSKGDYIEIALGDTLPGYGKLIRVDKSTKTFETSNNIYILKD